jgi:HK97 family phage major capsid protein
MDELIKQVKMSRARTTQKYRDFVEDAERRNVWGAAEIETEKRYLDELTELEGRVAELEDLKAVNAEMDRQRAPYEAVVRPSTRTSGHDERAVDEFFAGKRSHVDVELDFSKRDLYAESGSGANVVPTGFRRQLVDYLVEESAIMRLATVLNTPNGAPLEIPRLTAYGDTVRVVAEAGTATSGDPTLAKATLGAHAYFGLTEVSIQFAEDSGIDVRGMVARDHGVQLGTAIGYHLVSGTGSGQPAGLFDGATLGTAVQGTATTIEPDSLITLRFAPAPGYQARGYWAMNNSTAAAIRKLRSPGSGDYLMDINRGLTPGAPAELLGRPVVLDGQVPSVGSANLSVGFGDIERAFMVRTTPIRFETSDDWKFSEFLRAFRSVVRVDSAIVDPNAFKLMDTD